MHSLPSSLRRLGQIALGVVALFGVSSLRAQTATIGYSPVANLVAPSVVIFSGASLNANTAYVVPFQFNTLGDYSLTSVSLLLAGNASLADFSLSVTSTLPTSLTLPGALTTLSAAGSLSGSETAYNFTAGSAPTLTANTTYYLNIAYAGTDTANWILSASQGSSASTGSGGFVFIPVSGALVSGLNGYGGVTISNITYRSLTSGSFADLDTTIGAFSITAAAVSAVPEPSTYAALAGLGALVAVICVRRRQSRV